jgi:hypothetical protein
MRFLITMNMPSAHGSLVHQVTGEHSSNSIEEFCDVLNDNAFVVVGQYYKDANTADGEINWVYMGNIILNTEHIGKVHEQTERKSYGRPYGNSRSSSQNFEGSGAAVRDGRGVFQPRISTGFDPSR